MSGFLHTSQGQSDRAVILKILPGLGRLCFFSLHNSQGVKYLMGCTGELSKVRSLFKIRQTLGRTGLCTSK